MRGIKFLEARKHKKIGNNGFSLVELIVIVALMGVVAGIITTSISPIYSFHAKQCAKNIDAMLSKCKVGAMSKAGDVYLRLYSDTDGIYCQYFEGGVAVSDEKIAKDTVVISYTSSNEGVDQAVGTQGIYISFDRTTGGFLTLGAAASLGGAAVGDASYYPTAIIVASGEKNLTVRLVPTTGKHYVES